MIKQAEAAGQAPPMPPPPPPHAPLRLESAGGYNPDSIRQKLDFIIKTNELHGLYPASRLDGIVRRLSALDWGAFSRAWGVPIDIITDLAPLALYDVAIFIDDSGSMTRGTRIDDMEALVTRITEVVTQFDDDGISVRFINADPIPAFDGLRSAADVNRVLSSISYEYDTQIGTELNKQLIQPFVVSRIKNRQLSKPVVIYVITDGEPSEPRNTMRNVLAAAMRDCQSAGLRKALAVSFAQVGADEAASKFLSELDDDKEIGDFIDTVNDYDEEALQLSRKQQSLSPFIYLLKFALGAINPRYDSLD